MEDFLKNYVTKEKISEEFIMHLYNNIENADELKRKVKEFLQKHNKFNNNNYAHICILINVLKYKKSQGKKLNLPDDMYYMELPMLGKLEINIDECIQKIEKIRKRVEYAKIPRRNEKRGEEKTRKSRNRLIRKGQKILEAEKIDIAESQKWEKQYKFYIIKTYGRDSKEYEDYMFTLFEVDFLPISPNMLLNIMRQHFRKAIEEKLNLLF